jgi:hypothetical protein
MTDYFDLARECANSHGGGGVFICIITNALLLPLQPETFWQNCKKNSIEIHVTKYPIKLDHYAIEQTAKKYGVKLSYMDDTDSRIKTTNYVPFDLSGRQNVKKNIRLCCQINKCLALDRGRLYTCPFPRSAHIFNEYFNRNLQVSDADSIDIYKAKSIDEIFDFLNKPIPFCRYCNWEKFETQIPWHTSTKSISEWT